jgi:hypothetical protein
MKHHMCCRPLAWPSGDLVCCNGAVISCVAVLQCRSSIALAITCLWLGVGLVLVCDRTLGGTQNEKSTSEWGLVGGQVREVGE